MNCKNCGTPLNENDKFCQNCGMVVDSPVAQTNNDPFMANQQVNNQNNGIGMGNSQNVQTLNMNNNPMQNNVNMQPFNQPPMNEFNTNPIANKKGNSNMITIIMGVVIVVLLIVVVFLALNGSGTSKNNKDVKKEDPTVEPTKVSNTTNYVAGDYTFAIPNEFTVETNDTEITLYNEEKAMYMDTLAGYSTAMVSLDELKTNIEAAGIIVLDAKKETYNGVNMLIFGAEYNGEKRAIVYADIDNGILYAEIANISGEVDYDTVKNEFATIAKSAKYKATSNSIASSNKLKDLEKIIKSKK